MKNKLESKREYKKGQTYRTELPSFGFPGESYKIHILEIVDEDYVVYKVYGKRKQYWHYRIEHKMFLDLYIDRTNDKNILGVRPDSGEDKK